MVLSAQRPIYGVGIKDLKDKRPKRQRPNWTKDLMDKRPNGQKNWWTKDLMDKRPNGQRT